MVNDAKLLIGGSSTPIGMVGAARPLEYLYSGACNCLITSGVLNRFSKETFLKFRLYIVL